MKIINPNFPAPVPVQGPKAADVRAAVVALIAKHVDAEKIDFDVVRNRLGVDKVTLPDADIEAAAVAQGLAVEL